MRRYPIICALLLAACGHEAGPVTVISPQIPADLLSPPAGWTGPPPSTEGNLIDAAAAEKRARMQCTGQLLTISEIMAPN